MLNKTPPKVARKYLPYNNGIPPVPEVNLCLELACSHVLWSVLLLNKCTFSLSAINSLCVWFNSLSVITKNLVNCVTQTFLFVLTMAGIFLDRPCIFTAVKSLGQNEEPFLVIKEIPYCLPQWLHQS